MRHHCGAELYMTAHHGLYDVDRYRHHYCAQEPLPEPELEVWDSCEACGEPWVRIGDGPRLDPWTRELHTCITATVPEPPAQTQNPGPARQPSSKEEPRRTGPVAIYEAYSE